MDLAKPEDSRLVVVLSSKSLSSSPGAAASGRLGKAGSPAASGMLLHHVEGAAFIATIRRQVQTLKMPLNGTQRLNRAQTLIHFSWLHLHSQ